MKTTTRPRRLAACAACLLALASGLAGCNPLSTWSDRTVVPGADPAWIVGKRLVVGPYRPDDSRDVPDTPLDSGAAAAVAKRLGDHDPNLAAFDDFTEGAVRAAVSWGEHAKPAEHIAIVPHANYDAYFTSPDGFMDVTVDGKTHFQVPKAETLRANGAEADVGIFLAMLRCETSQIVNTIYGSNGEVRGWHREFWLECHTRFLIWDYEHARAMAAGKVGARIMGGRFIDEAEWQKAAGGVLGEILSKDPFR